MNSLLNKEQKLLRKAIREFSEKEILPMAIETNNEEKISNHIMEQMAQIGLFGVFVPSEYGGGGMNYLSYCIAVEELSRIDCSHGVTVAFANSYGIEPILSFGSEIQKKEWLPKLCSGEILACYGAIKSGSGEKLSARLQDQMWIINGTVKMVVNSGAKMAGLILVQAIDDNQKKKGKETSWILIPIGANGLSSKTITNKLAWRAANISDLFFDDCRVPEKNLLGKNGNGKIILEKIMDNARLSFAAVALGGAQGAYEQALKYTKKRMLYGKPLSTFQVNAIKLSKMATDIEAGRNLLYNACKLKDSGKPFRKEAAMATVYCSETMGGVSDESIQLHGGNGLMNEMDIERFYRDFKGITIVEESLDDWRNIISKEIGCYNAK